MYIYIYKSPYHDIIGKGCKGLSKPPAIGAGLRQLGVQVTPWISRMVQAHRGIHRDHLLRFTMSISRHSLHLIIYIYIYVNNYIYV